MKFIPALSPRRHLSVHAARAVRCGPPVVESLEGRQLLSTSAVAALEADASTPDTTPPRLIGQQLLGTIDAVTGIVLTFSEPLDPATAQDPDAYVIRRVFHREGDDEGGLFDDFVPFLDTSEEDSSGVLKLRIDSAAYDEAARTVTLTPHNPFRGTKRFRQLRVTGEGDRSLKDLAGNRLDGDEDGREGGNARLKFKWRDRGTLRFREADGDRVTLRLRGGGELIAGVRRGDDPAPIVFITGAEPGESVLTGTVKRGRKGDGVADLQQLTGIASAQVSIVDNPAFRIGMAVQ